jgi:tetratricopeptide (TPR) repeat protein
MGKALLEGQRFGDASDVFHRVLSSMPDDFIAHLGMSIIREDEGNLDAAIWHMERSFEVQPSNAAVQVELRRLYSLRDGLTPQKIQLTRGALARMSAKSNLYSQAISELRAALSDDPQRPDLQVVLATMYTLSGSRMEAIETCNTLLSKLPYCFEANRILAEILPETERAEKAQEYKNRLIELDPYYAHLSQVAPTVDQVTDSAVTIERFEYDGEVIDSTTTEQPEWATALGVSIDDEPDPQDETAQWMVSESDEEFPTEEISQEEEIIVESEAAPEEIPAEEDDVEQLPDWMSNEEGVVEEDVEGGETETPEWLQDVMEGSGPEETDTSQAAAAAAVIGQELSEIEQEEAEKPPDEVDTLTSESIPSEDLDEEDSTESIPTEAEAHEEVNEAELPSDGLTPPVEAIPGGVVAGAAVASASLSAAFEDDEGQEIEESVVEIPEEEPLDLDTAAPEQLDEGIAPEDDSPTEEGESEIPDWLLDLGEGMPEEKEPEFETEPGLVEELIEEEPDVIQELDEEKDGDTSVIEFAEESEVSESDSALIEDFSETGDLTTDEPIEAAEDVDLEPEALEEITPQPEIEAAELEPLAQFKSDVPPGEEEFPESLPDWLSAVSPEAETEIIEQGVAEPGGEDEIVRAEIPDWLQKMEQQHLAEMAAASITAEQLKELEIDSDFTDLSGEDVPSWLMSAMETEGIEEVSEISQVEDIDEIISAPISPDFEPEEAVIEEELIPESEQVSEEISAEILDEEISLEPVGEEAIEEKPALEMVLEEEDIVESDTQPVMVEEFVETAEIEEEIQLEETITPELSEVDEITEIEEFLAPEEFEEIIPDTEIEAELEPESIVSEELLDLPADAPLSADDEDAAMAWLESLAARQGAAEEELLSAPEERIDEPPEWVQEEALEEEQPAVVEQGGIIEEIAEAAVVGAAIAALASEDEEEEAEPAVTEEEVSPAEPTEWIPEIEQELEKIPEVEQEQAPVELEPEPETEPELEKEITPIEEQEIVETVEDEQPPEEVPDWLTALAEEEELSPEYQTTDWSPDMLVEDETELAAEPDLEAKIDLNAASLSQLEKVPGVGFIHAQNIINHRASSGPFKSLDELEDIPDLTPEVIDVLKTYLTVEMVPEVSAPISTHPDLQNAWNSINSGEIETAVDQYTQLIKKDEHLDEVIRDLQEALGKYPLDASLYQALGDAYLHANMLQEALDAYNRAEDLIK